MTPFTRWMKLTSEQVTDRVSMHQHQNASTHRAVHQKLAALAGTLSTNPDHVALPYNITGATYKVKGHIKPTRSDWLELSYLG